MAITSKLPIGRFAAWLYATLRADRDGTDMDVPCGECRGCCTSAYFIHIAPDETEALAAIPKRLLFAAPGLPKGHKLLGYDDKGHCPMLKDNACSIYAQRPRACRQYDCRVLTATGISEAADKPAIVRQAKRWRFGAESEADKRLLAAVRAAAKFLRKHGERFPPGFVPANAPQQAMLAIRVHKVFLRPPSEAGNAGYVERILALVAE